MQLKTLDCIIHSSYSRSKEVEMLRRRALPSSSLAFSSPSSLCSPKKVARRWRKVEAPVSSLLPSLHLPPPPSRPFSSHAAVDPSSSSAPFMVRKENAKHIIYIKIFLHKRKREWEREREGEGKGKGKRDDSRRALRPSTSLSFSFPFPFPSSISLHISFDLHSYLSLFVFI